MVARAKIRRSDLAFFFAVKRSLPKDIIKSSQDGSLPIFKLWVGLGTLKGFQSNLQLIMLTKVESGEQSYAIAGMIATKNIIINKLINEKLSFLGETRYLFESV